MRPEQTRTYDRANSVVFLKTDEPFGGLSNMAGGFPLWVNGTRILTSEALYQACRFPHRPEVQALIIEQRSPMTAKMKSKPYRHDSRPDWDRVRVKVMRWCLRVKLAQNWRAFSELLLKTGERPIVEESRKDTFWGAKATEDGTLVGMNVLGRLLMELREVVKVEGREPLTSVQPLAIPDFLLGGRPIDIVVANVLEHCDEPGKAIMAPDRAYADGHAFRQSSLFDGPAVKEAPIAVYSAFRAKSVHVADLRPYAEYKESGLPWLGQVPGHWSVERTKWRFRHRKELNVNGDHTNVLSLTLRGVVNNNPDDPEGLVPKDYRTYQLFATGDLVFKLIDLENLRTSRVGLVHEDGIMSSAYVRLTPSSPTNIRYFYHQFYDLYSRGIYNQLGAGVRSTLGPTDLLNIGIAIPPPDEQAAIVRFLDWANGRLERAIRAKRKVIALLNEQKQAIIHRAVTRGLDPAVPLKPSGIPWLGDIPQHWETLQVRRLVSLVTSGSRGWAEFYSDDGYIFLQSGNLGRSMALNLSFVQHVRPPSGAEGERTRVRRDDVLVCITGALTGNVVLVDVDLPTPAFINQHVALIRLKPDAAVPRFLAYVLRSPIGTSQFKTNEYGGTKQGLGLGEVKDVFVPLPPQNEQLRISAELGSALAKFDTAISRLEREIELLREYRTRLVADVVTGKLDVREAALLLPDEAPPDTVEDDANLGDETENEAEGIEA